jgi:hypothetical protein
MKNYLTQFYQEHKKLTWSEKITNKLNQAKTCFISMGVFAFLVVVLMNFFHIRVLPFSPEKVITSIVANSIMDILFSILAFMGIGLIPISIAQSQENKFEETIKNLMSEEKSNLELNHVLEKIKLLDIYQTNEADIVIHYKKLITEMNDKKVETKIVEKICNLICNPEMLNQYCEENKELIEKSNEEIQLIIQQRIADILLKDQTNKEQELKEKLSFIKNFHPLTTDTEILKKEKVLNFNL